MDHDAMKCPRCHARPFSPCAASAHRVVYLCNQRRHMEAIASRGIDPYSGKPETILEEQADLFEEVIA